MMKNLASLISLRKILLISLLQISNSRSTLLKNLESRIVGGEQAAIADYPHSAFLLIRCVRDVTGTFLCGASILSHKILMTAAHCIQGCNVSRSNITVFIGNVKKMEGAAHDVRAFTAHSEFDITRGVNDIGLILVRNQMVFSDNVKKVVVLRNPPYFEEAEVAGWGLLDDASTQVTQFLRHAAQRVLTYKNCKKNFEDLKRGQICVGPDPNAKKGYPNVGDSGSALVVRKNIQIGIVSFKRPAVSYSETVYTDVSYYYNWIQETACELLSSA